ncbi:nucleoside hydrolase [Nocardia takedensis]|uniref:nucleoside hydrolase n=1 Tax=Nocardia takedensis TaxID=259390 RepID=UPI003F75C07F
MGDHDHSDETIEASYRAALGVARRSPQLAALTAKLEAAGPPPPRVQRTPIILDTDIGGDPDDAVAVTCAAKLPELSLVITADEHRGERARLARHLLDLVHRPDVQVIAGADLGNSRYWVAEDLVPEDIAIQPDDVLGAVRALCERTTGPIRWVGCGPLTNLAAIVRAAPELARRLVVTQMGGAINYRDPDRAEHNFRLDPEAAHTVLATEMELTLVLSDVTFREEMAIDAHSDLYRLLSQETAPPWAHLLTALFDRWFTRRYPSSKQHDPFALTVAMELPFATLGRPRLRLAPDARVSVDPTGRPTWVTTAADYPVFGRWLADQLTTSPTTSASDQPDASPTARR